MQIYKKSVETFQHSILKKIESKFDDFTTQISKKLVRKIRENTCHDIFGCFFPKKAKVTK